jgi:aminoglycoside phosphotransferase (APT) family kinase protein
MSEEKERDMKSRIEAYLLTKVDGINVLRFEREAGGQAQETWFLDAEWIDEGKKTTKNLVLRRSQKGGPLSVGSDQMSEYDVMKCLGKTQIPVPRVYWAEDNPKWLDRPFFIMDRLPGTHSFAELIQDPDLNRKIAIQFVEILAAIHNLDWEKLGLSFLGVPSSQQDCALRELDKWEGIYRSEILEPQPLAEAEFMWFRRNAPHEVERICFLWGDPGPGNFMYENGRIVGLLDWELAHIGDPMDDLGFFIWRSGINVPLMETEELLEVYQEKSGIPVNRDRVTYYETLSHLRTAIMTHTATVGFCSQENLNPNFAITGLTLFRMGLKKAADLMGL